jgi:uncharacterized protein (TIGR03437 family)
VTAPPGQPSFLTVASSADSVPSGTIAPLELISLFGSGIGPDAPLAGQVVDGAFANQLGGYQVLFNGVPAPLLFAGPGQFNAVAPAAISGQQTVQIEAVGPGGSTVFPTVFVAALRPRIFAQNGEAVATNQDGSLNSASNPARTGSIVTLWATGTGLMPGVEPIDGAIVSPTAAAQLPISVVIGFDTPVSYAGQAPSAVLGLTQINYQVPSGSYGNSTTCIELGSFLSNCPGVEATRLQALGAEQALRHAKRRQN